MHQGVSYLVERLDLSSKTADLSYHTRTEDSTDIDVLGSDDDPTSASTLTARANECKVTTRWSGFRRICRSGNRVSDVIELDLPPYSFYTQAVWVTIPEPVRTTVGQSSLQFRGGVHGASHAILGILPLRIMCGSCDLGTGCADPRGGADRILLHDKHPGGIGLASQVKLLFGDIAAAALELVSACSCDSFDGCPNCVQSFACGDYNKNLDKQASILVLEGVIQCYSQS